MNACTVAEIRFRAFRTERERPIRNGRYLYSYDSLCVIEVETDDGTVGVGILPPILVPGGEDVYRALIGMFSPMVLGRDPNDCTAIWHELWQPKLFGKQGFETRIIGGIDIALWDIRSKLAGLPLSRFLGAEIAKPFYVAGGYYVTDNVEKDLDDTLERALALDPAGVKMKIGGLHPAEDLERVRRARSSIPEDVDLMVDANGAYEVHEALEVARGLGTVGGITWFEEPVHPDNIPGYRRVADLGAVATAGGENTYTLFGFRELITEGGISFVNVDAQITGGFTEFLRIAALADAYGVQIAPHGSPLVHVPLMAALPTGAYVEYYAEDVQLLDHTAFEFGIRLSGRTVLPSRAPGLGLSLNLDQIAGAEVESATWRAQPA